MPYNIDMDPLSLEIFSFQFILHLLDISVYLQHVFSYNSIGQIDNMVHVICSSLKMLSMKYISVITPNEFSVPFSTLAIFWLAYDAMYISYH